MCCAKQLSVSPAAPGMRQRSRVKELIGVTKAGERKALGL